MELTDWRADTKFFYRNETASTSCRAIKCGIAAAKSCPLIYFLSIHLHTSPNILQSLSKVLTIWVNERRSRNFCFIKQREVLTTRIVRVEACKISPLLIVWLLSFNDSLHSLLVLWVDWSLASVDVNLVDVLAVQIGKILKPTRLRLTHPSMLLLRFLQRHLRLNLCRFILSMIFNLSLDVHASIILVCGSVRAPITHGDPLEHSLLLNAPGFLFPRKTLNSLLFVHCCLSYLFCL